MTPFRVGTVRRCAGKLLGLGLLLITIPLSLGGVSGGATAEAHGPLTHMPIGTANLTWSKDNGGALTVAITMSGLAPNSTHPAHIHAGTCDMAHALATSSITYTLNNVVANALGQGTSQTKITAIKPDMPTAAIIVHNGPTLATSNQPWQDQSLPIACANIVAPSMGATRTATTSVSFGMTPAIDQHVTGTMALQLEQGKLVVTLHVAQLQPHSQHIAHVHRGSCASQGPIVYDLQTLQADSTGAATSTTVIDGVKSIPQRGWYVNIHLAPTMADLATQTGFAPIACGDVNPTP